VSRAGLWLGPSFRVQMATFSLCPHMLGKGAGELSEVLFLGALIL
jgi:hypothetical protein